MTRRPTFTADDDTAISLCRMTYDGDCRCEKNGRVICDPMIAAVEAQRDHLTAMRRAFAGHYPEDGSQ
jgi:hypothetical protein